MFSTCNAFRRAECEGFPSVPTTAPELFIALQAKGIRPAAPQSKLSIPEPKLGDHEGYLPTDCIVPRFEV
jgi:hypothetical protein